MNKSKLKKAFYAGLIIFIGLALTVTYFFVLYEKNSIISTLSLTLSILRPIVFGAVFAYIMKSTANFYEKWLYRWFSRSKKAKESLIKKASIAVSVLFTLITWLIIIGIVLLIVIPQTYQSISNFVNTLIPKLPEYEQTLFDFADKFVAKYNFIEPYVDTVLDWITSWFESDFIPAITNFGTGLFQVVVNLFKIIVDIIIGLVVSVLLLLGRKKIAKTCELALHCLFKEKTVGIVVDEVKYADKMFSGFLEGKVIDSAIIGLAYYIGLELLNVPYPALIAVICGVTNIIPIFGPFLGAIPSGIIILTADPIKVIHFIIFVCVTQFIDGYIIDPHIVGSNIKMSSLGVVFAVILFGGLWGFPGLLVGVPTLAVICDILKKIGIFLLNKKGKQSIYHEYISELSEKSNEEAPTDTAPTDESNNSEANASIDASATEEDNSSSEDKQI